MLNCENNHCPYLPSIHGTLPITHTKEHRAECGPAFYFACLELAQSLWISNLPAQALLQVNRSFMAQLPADHEITNKYPIGFRVIAWITEKSGSEQAFLGNPVRHFQHLATRMNFNQPQPELRVWRAWCCFHIAESILPDLHFPRDEVQIERERLAIPSQAECLSMLAKLSPHTHELEEVKKLLL